MVATATGFGEGLVPIALLALMLSTFTICTAEWGIAGLLPSLSSDLLISIPTAGLLVTFYALGVAVGGPILSVLTTRFSHKRVLIVFMSVFVAGNVLCALAPNYEMLVAARVLVACGHGLFFGIATIVATSLMPGRQGFALSMLFTGVMIAQLLGVPAGTAIGNAFGWRATFWAVAAASALATIALAVVLPPSERREHASGNIGADFRALNHQQVYLTYLAVALFVTGGLTISTYLVPLMTNVTHIPLVQTPWYLLILGLGGFIGNFIGGRLADWKLMPTLIAIFFGGALLHLTLVVSSKSALTLGINLLILGAVGFSFGGHVTKRILSAAGDSPNLASTLTNTAFNIGIASGAVVGGMVLDAGFAYDQLPLFAVLLDLAGACIIVISMLLDRRETTPAAAPT
jgi:MFS transporter, DHA1 family, inner membrane transport protein